MCGQPQRKKLRTATCTARTVTTIGLADVPQVAAGMFEGKVQGRTVVDVNA